MSANFNRARGHNSNTTVQKHWLVFLVELNFGFFHSFSVDGSILRSTYIDKPLEEALAVNKRPDTLGKVLKVKARRRLRVVTIHQHFCLVVNFLLRTDAVLAQQEVLLIHLWQLFSVNMVQVFFKIEDVISLDFAFLRER